MMVWVDSSPKQKSSSPWLGEAFFSSILFFLILPPGWEDPLEEGVATHSSIFAWRIHMDRGARRATVHRVTKSPTQLSDIAQHPRLIHKRK